MCNVIFIAIGPLWLVYPRSVTKGERKTGKGEEKQRRGEVRSRLLPYFFYFYLFIFLAFVCVHASLMAFVISTRLPGPSHRDSRGCLFVALHLGWEMADHGMSLGAEN